MSNSINIRDINPLEHITSDIAKAMANYEAILNGLVTWNTTDNQNVTVRLMTDSDPFFVDYTFPSRSASTKTAIRMLSPDVRGGGFDALNALEMPAVMSDTVTLRFSEVSYPAAQWSLYENAMAYKEDGEASVDYPEHVFVNVKGLNSSDPDAYVKVLTTVAVPSGTAFALGVNCCKAVATWTASPCSRLGTSERKSSVRRAMTMTMSPVAARGPSMRAIRSCFPATTSPWAG